MSKEIIAAFLDEIKKEGRSSPAGKHWHDFYKFLSRNGRNNCTNPPVPLILAASGESDATKHRRLETQLEWALENDCLSQSLEFLKKLSPDKWNHCSTEKWDKSSYQDFE